MRPWSASSHACTGSTQRTLIHLTRLPVRLERQRQRFQGRKKSKQAVAGLLDSWRQGRKAAAKEAEAQPTPTAGPPASTASSPSTEDDLLDDDLCTAECVTEVHDLEGFKSLLKGAKPKTLVVIDFYKTSCGACRYLAPAFLKLCRASCHEHGPVRFLKHNIYNEFDEFSDLAEHLRIKNVPLFYFFRNGELLDRFAGGDKHKIANAINTHAGWEVLHV